MKSPQKSKSHHFDRQLFDEKSSEIEIPSLDCSIIRWSILRNRNPIHLMLDYSMQNRQKSESHLSIPLLSDDKSSEIGIPSLHSSIIGWEILNNRKPIPSILDHGMKNPKKSKSHPSIARVLDDKSSLIEIPSLQYLINEWKIVGNRNPIPSILDYWMKNRRKSRSHPSIARVLDDKSSLIGIPSLQYLIMGWKILRNRNPIPPLLEYWMINPH
jgi:hypothetical protein